MWLIEGRSALEVINTHTTNSDQLVITIADGRPPGGRELVGSDLTISRIGVIPPILTAKHCAVNSASAIRQRCMDLLTSLLASAVQNAPAAHTSSLLANMANSILMAVAAVLASS